tara:strand:- start:191 stop:772 length:582 start_codon:yes stop_codon:yes gene_type:complete
MFKELIWVKKNSLTPEFCRHVIDKFEKEPNKGDGRVGGNSPRVDKKIKITTDFGLSYNDNWKDEDSIFFKELKIGLDEYNSYLKNINRACGPDCSYKMQDTGYKLQKYDPNGFYVWHNDWCMTQEGSRVFVFMWYLNTLKKEEKGYTEFLDGTRLQPTCGSLVFFPATWTYVHRGYRPKVPKYLCNGWIYAKP